MTTAAGSLEVCPSCGEFVDHLLPITGFCELCTRESEAIYRVGGIVCSRCKRREVKDDSHKICRYCRHEKWLAEHADELDRALAGNGLRIGIAIRVVKTSNRITCRSCGRSIKKATRGVAYFCNRPQCRTAHNKLRRYIYVKHLPREVALELVLEGIHGENNRTNPQGALR